MWTDIIQLQCPTVSINLELIDNLPIWCRLQRWLLQHIRKLASSLPQAAALAIALALLPWLHQPGSSTLCHMGFKRGPLSNVLGLHWWCSPPGAHSTKRGPKVWQAYTKGGPKECQAYSNEYQQCGKPTPGGTQMRGKPTHARALRKHKNV